MFLVPQFVIIIFLVPKKATYIIHLHTRKIGFSVTQSIPLTFSLT